MSSRSNTTGGSFTLLGNFGFAALGIAFNVASFFKNLYFLFFLTNVIFLDPITAGTIISISFVWDAVNDPMIGFFVANRKFKNGERMRPYAIHFGPFLMITLVLMFTNFNILQSAKYWGALILSLIYSVFMTFMGLSLQSAALVTNDSYKRLSLNTFFTAGNTLGSYIGTVLCLPLMRMFDALDTSGNISDGNKIFLVAVIFASIGIICIIFFHFTTKENIKPAGKERVSVKKALASLMSQRLHTRNLLFLLFFNTIIYLMLNSMLYFTTYVMRSTGLSTQFMSAFTISGMIGIFFIKTLHKKLGRRNTMLCVPLIIVAGKIWFLFNPYSIGAVYVSMITAGLMNPFAAAIVSTNRNDIVDIIEWKQGVRLDSIVSTFDSLMYKMVSSLIPIVLSFTLQHFRYDAAIAEQPSEVVSALIFFMGIPHVALCLLMLAATAKFPIEEEMEKMRAEKRKDAIG
ncbi:MAG: MFS transporter [Syntrophomonadaceae bacterium]|jgi:Na+/melibiose symporter-like transporter|nr:MFS transporter [Syntrophomonadaceae bacterium]